jgi:hypothetical protein
MFPPDPTSLQCKKPNPDVVCDPVEWSIRVPRGKYEVKMTVGDAEKKLGYSLTVNAQFIFKDVMLEKNQFSTESIDIESTDGTIVVEQKCDPVASKGHCEFVWSRMSAIEIK